MKAVVFHKPKDVRVERVPDPVIQHPRDVILRVTSTAISGSDLHIYNGMFPQFHPLVMGHELMGIVEDKGEAVGNLELGDRVVVRFPIACGRCWFCTHDLPTACERSNRHHHYGPEGETMREQGGGQAELVRVPFADFGVRKVPDQLTDEQVLFLSDILPTGWSAIEWANMKGGETVAVFGCGPVGIMAQKCAWLHGAKRVFAIDTQRYRLLKAREVAGAETIDGNDRDVVEVLRGLTEGRGPDVCVDAVGMEADRGVIERVSSAMHMQRGTMKVLSECLSAVRRGGHVSVIGVYGAKLANFPIGKIFDKGIRLAAGQALVQVYIDELLDLIVSGKLRADDVITHELPLDQAPKAYDIFAKRKDNCVKVVLKPGMAEAA